MNAKTLSDFQSFFHLFLFWNTVNRTRRNYYLQLISDIFNFLISSLVFLFFPLLTLGLNMANYTTASEERGDAFPTRNIASTPE